MFQGKILNRFSGISKKNGNQFYTIDLVVDIPSGRVTSKNFVDEDVYKKAEKIPFDTLVTVTCGVNQFGSLCIKDIISKN